jgi:hypothetical protein
MNRCILTVILIGILLTGCVAVNKDPDILLTDPYRRVTYIADPGDRYQQAEVIQVTTRGSRANILNSIPQLYLKALEWSGQQRVALGNFRITSFTRQEEFEIPYQECRSVPGMISVPQTSCVSGSCKTTYVQRTLFNRHCWTEYRTETREVLYQKVVAEILTAGPEG